MELTSNILKQIINDFANKGIIFSNEAQFQFALAQAIKEYFKETCEVLLEHLILIKDRKDDNNREDDKKRIKMYVDIIIKIDNDYYPIELKYKTTDKNLEYKKNDSSKSYTFKQGAEDIGCYDFIKDIYRIEQLVIGLDNNENLETKFKNENTSFEDPYFDYTSLGKNVKFKRGFSIIITNDHKYDKEIKNGDFPLKKDNTHYYWEQFFLSDKRTLDKKLCWVNGQGKEIINNSPDYEKNKILQCVSASRFKPIILQKSYTLNWEKYDVKGYEGESIKKYPFKYLIIDVNKK